MKPISVQFKDIKKALGSLEITIGPVLIDVSQMHDPPMPVPDYQTLESLVDVDTMSSIFCLLDKFRSVREEISSNISMPIEEGIKTEYLNHILIFYSDLESSIKEDEQGKLTCSFMHFLDISYNELIEYHQKYFDGFLNSLRTDLRAEIKYLYNLINTMKKMPEITSNQNKTIQEHNIEWKREKNDLIELVRALKLIGAINNSTNNITYKEAYKFFGDIFHTDLKRPEDQLRQVSESFDTPYFLEELLSKYKEDQEFLKRKRKA